MSLPKRIYDLYRELQASTLVETKNATPDNMLAFGNLLNQCSPTTPEEVAQRDLVRGMYYSNPVGFLKYVGLARNRVGALVLYTESKRIAKFFGLQGRVHISWAEDTNTYNVTAHVPREQRPGYVAPDPATQDAEAPQEEFKQVQTRREKYVNRNRAQKGQPLLNEPKGVKSKKPRGPPREPRQPRPPRQPKQNTSAEAQPASAEPKESWADASA
jgi:hypothetical protein